MAQRAVEHTTFFHVKLEKIKILNVKNRLEFIFWTRHKWQKVDSFSEFVVSAVNWAITVTNNQQRVCKIMFLIRTFVKANINLMCGSFSI